MNIVWALQTPNEHDHENYNVRDNQTQKLIGMGYLLQWNEIKVYLSLERSIELENRTQELLLDNKILNYHFLFSALAGLH